MPRSRPPAPATAPVGAPAPGPAAVTRPRAPRRIVPLEQIPVWEGFAPVAPVGEEGDAPAVAALLAGLNPDQARAVTHDAGPLLVVAGAGTGKTQVITRRIAWLIGTRRARPSEILALTFTDKAAEEMQARVDQLVPYGYADTQISTFHAFGDRVLREHAYELGLSPDLRVMTRAEVVVFLRERLFELGLDEYLPLGDPTKFLDALAGLFSRARDEDVSPERYAVYAAALEARAAALEAAAAGPDAGGDAAEDAAAARDEARRQTELARAYGRYTALTASSGAIDFGDQVALALKLLRTSPSARASLQARYRYILVDEFQDTNRAQSELVALLAERHRNVMVVGDDDQSIYRFRGAAISNILEFRDRYPGARTVVLRRNYRSYAPILEAAHRCIVHNDPERLEVRVGISKRLEAERAVAEPAPVRHHAFPSGGAEADWIAAEIAGRVAGGARPKDFAVLVRANAHADAIVRALNVAGVPWRSSGTTGLYARPEVKTLLAVLRAAADPSSSPDVYALATSGRYGIPGGDLSDVMATARRRNRSAMEVLEELAAQPGILRLTDAGRAGLGRLTLDLRRLRDLAHERSGGEVLYAFLRETGWLADLAGADDLASEEAIANIARFFDIVRAQSALLPDDRAIFLAPHLGTLVEAGDDPPTADLDPDVDAVAVMTVHKAKGLEFPVVFLPGLVADRFPIRGRSEALALPPALVDASLPEGDVHLPEERRLFYVAMTRARDELILTHAADYGGGRARRLSPFVLEALDLPLSAAVPGAGLAEAPSGGALDRIAAFDGTAVAAVPPVAREPQEGPLTLSHSQIDAYLTCPARYRFSYVARIPTPPHHNLTYGSALHAAVQEFHRAHARGRVMTEGELFAALDAAWSNEGFISREHELARLGAARDALLRFREDQLKPGAVIPAWVERDFSFVLGGDRIRGRFDRVDIEPAGEGSDADAFPPASAEPPTILRADVVEPQLGLTGRERVTITDYKTGDVRDPAKAKSRAKDSLQLQIYAMAYEALSGRLPDAVQLHFLDTGLTGRVPMEEKRLEAAREKIATAADGIRRRAFEPRPSMLACTYCPFRDVCPASAAR